MPGVLKQDAGLGISAKFFTFIASNFGGSLLYSQSPVFLEDG